MRNKKQKRYAIKEKLSAFGQDSFSNESLVRYMDRKLWRASGKCYNIPTCTFPWKLLMALSLTNKNKIKSELVRFNFVQ